MALMGDVAQRGCGRVLVALTSPGGGTLGSVPAPGPGAAALRRGDSAGQCRAASMR